MFAPAGTPRPIIDKLSAEMNKTLRLPAIQKSFAGQVLVLMPSTPESFLAQLKKEIATVGPIIKAANITMDAN